MNEESVPVNPAATLGTAEQALTISEAALALGVDAFTVYSLFQRGRLNPIRAVSGEITLPRNELNRLTGAS